MKFFKRANKIMLTAAIAFCMTGVVLAIELPKKEASIVVELPAQDVDKRPVISRIALSSDGRLMVIAGDDHQLRILDARTGELRQEFEAHLDWVRDVVFANTSDRIISVEQNGVIKIWDLAALNSPTVLREKVLGARKVEISPDGTKFAVCGYDQPGWNEIRRVRLRPGRVLLRHDNAKVVVSFYGSVREYDSNAVFARWFAFGRRWS